MEKLDFYYRTSRDYEKLYELAKKQRVVCFITRSKELRSGDTIEWRAVCATNATANSEEIIVGNQGFAYITAIAFECKSMKEDFLEQCSFFDLEYIDPGH